jgi:hypothetical protein
MPQFALYIDKVGAMMLDWQEYSEERNRAYYLLADNPAVRVTVRGENIWGCTGQVLGVVAGFEECWGQWEANAPLKGRRTYAVTIFSRDKGGRKQDDFSAWLQRNYLDEDAPYREPGGEYSTPVHEPRR